ncbi:hypothetical protein V2A60_002584 [Cordyceps javanica]
MAVNHPVSSNIGCVSGWARLAEIVPEIRSSGTLSLPAGAGGPRNATKGHSGLLSDDVTS